ncbi:hypothetical protein [Lentzea sp. NPDC055074]
MALDAEARSIVLRRHSQHAIWFVLLVVAVVLIGVGRAAAHRRHHVELATGRRSRAAATPARAGSRVPACFRGGQQGSTSQVTVIREYVPGGPWHNGRRA